MKKVKITDLPIAENLNGLYTIAASDTTSVAVPFSLILNKAREGIPVATIHNDGLMSNLDKQRLGNCQTVEDRDKMISLFSNGKYTSLSRLVTEISYLPFTANAVKSTAFGENSIVYGAFNFATGWGAKAGNSANPQDREKYANFSTGYNTQSSGGFCFAAGYESNASGQCSVAIGNNTRASGYCSLACGKQTTASGQWAVALGLSNSATANNAFAMGWNTQANGHQSSAFGEGNTVNTQAGFVIGKYAVGGTNRIFEVGCGTSNTARHTAFYIDTEGEIWFWHKGRNRYVALSSVMIER